MRRTSPLAIDYLMIIIGIGSISWLHLHDTRIALLLSDATTAVLYFA
jgi:hypothetical protein